MLYSSVVFLFFFLPVVLIGHSLLPFRFKNVFLLAASLFFYAYGDARYLPLFLALTAVNYLCARGMDRFTGRKRTLMMALSVSLNVAALVYYKYSGLLFPGMESIPALPLGISFFIFQSLSYVLDVYAGRTKSEPSPVNYTTYIMLFPQLIAGPIVRYSDVARELHERRVRAQDLETGMLQFVIGLSSKALLANRIGVLYDQLMQIPDRGALGSLLALAACGFQYYYDFAGYSLMAIGIGRMMGFAFPHNFNHPFAADSIRDFWHRWHITLSQWLSTYIYLPLGGSRVGKARLAVNLLITWGVSGLWHGAGWNFLAWGLYFGVLMLFERLVYGQWLKKHRIAAHVYAMTAVLLSWMLFSQESLPALSAFAAQLISPSIGDNVMFALSCHASVFALALLFAVPAIARGLYARLSAHGALRTVTMAALFVLCVMELLGSAYNPFLYFRF
ncbi:MAG: MBOAT family protein [Clostridia bacterium]|nr:MBOAT family protein [Clostridia bacterium]